MSEVGEEDDEAGTVHPEEAAPPETGEACVLERTQELAEEESEGALEDSCSERAVEVAEPSDVGTAILQCLQEEEAEQQRGA